ncbi:MAG: LysM domain-containing protein [Chloroflexi bacterium]|nr:LysM domain-containing protein [Chloroflexota bacterium]
MYYYSHRQNPRNRGLILGWGLFLALMLSACAGENSAPPPPSPTVGQLTPYWTSTPTPALQREASDSSLTPAPAATPLPTPTPLIYNIVKDDTLTSVAFRNGISLEDLLSANPGIDPNFLTIGMSITIPTAEGSLISLPLPTPIPVTLHSPICYPTSDGGLWCLVLVENNQPHSVENISALISLLTSSSANIPAQVAIPALNLLIPGQAIPLAAFFAPPIPEDALPRAELLTALPISADSKRYLDTGMEISNISIAQSQRQATVTGEVRLSEAGAPARHIYLAAAAYDADGNPIGFRKQEILVELAPGDVLPFDITVFSLGPPIANVEVLCEARP